MGKILAIDLGTTALKFVVVGDGGEILHSKEKAITTNFQGKFITQSPKEWYEAFCDLSKEYFEHTKDKAIEGLIFSGQMQDLILVDENGESICDAILYNDQRGEEIVKSMDAKILQALQEKTCNGVDGSIPIAKLLWVKQNQAEIYSKIHKILISSKDYIICKLCGSFVSDVTSLATSGMMDILNKSYVEEIKQLGIDENIFPQIAYTDEVVGEVLEIANSETGIPVGTKIFAGSGDAGATTLASGIIGQGELNINVGTSGWIASISNNPSENSFTLCAINRDKYINVVPLLNAGNVHKWIAKTIGCGENIYDDIHDCLEKSSPTANGLLFLPYIIGERFPVADSDINGCYIGVGATTTRADMARSALEGVAFSVRQGLEALGITPKKVSLIGGGARESGWNEIFANILGIDVVVFENSEFMPSIALSNCVKLANGKISSYEEGVEELIKNTKNTVYKCNKDTHEQYNKAYERFLKIYPNVKNI